MKRSRWQDLQGSELAYHVAKDVQKLPEYKLAYWRRLLEILPDDVSFTDTTRILDLGCGGASILLALSQGTRIGVDPLMADYLNMYPYLSEHSDIQWMAGTGEDIVFDEPFDVVFSLNALDHVLDPERIVDRIRTHVRPGGHCVLTLNSHNTRFFRSYYALLYRFIDPHHPHQFCPRDVLALFHGFAPVAVRPIDDIWLPFAAGYRRDVLRRPAGKRRNWVATLANPFKWLPGFCSLVLDMPRHPQRPGQRSIYSDHLYVLRREGAA